MWRSFGGCVEKEEEEEEVKRGRSDSSTLDKERKYLDIDNR